jgi:PIN domain nuclease of toxin-antitoxin system
MKVLLDTHALVWALQSPELLSKTARAAMEESEVVASVANFWELSLKAGKKDALVPEPRTWWRDYVQKANLRTLPIRISDVMALALLPHIHKDPFDRILAAQALTEMMPLVTKDAHLGLYGVQTIW